MNARYQAKQRNYRANKKKSYTRKQTRRKMLLTIPANLKRTNKLIAMHQNAEIFAIQIPCDTDTRRIATDYSLSTFIFGVAGPACAVRSTFIITFQNFYRFQPQTISTRALCVQLIAIAIDLHHARLCMTCIVDRFFFSFTLLIQIFDDAPTTAYAIVRDAVDWWPNRKVKYDHLA